MSSNKILLCAALAVAASSAQADVTVTTQTSGKAAFINVGGEAVHQIKGTRQRSDQSHNGKTQTMIIDIDGRRFVSLDAKKKSAQVTPLDSIADELQKVGVGTLDATLTKTCADQADRRLPLHGPRHQSVAAIQPHRPERAREWTSTWCCRAPCA